MSLPVRGAWIEMGWTRRTRRCGLRSLPVRGAWIEIADLGTPDRLACRSLPVRGAWIEISRASVIFLSFPGRSPCGERGLKLPREICEPVPVPGRSPCGERGLKSVVRQSFFCPFRSLPVRGAWIEIFQRRSAGGHGFCRSPCGERGLKWVIRFAPGRSYLVAPRAGSVD